MPRKPIRKAIGDPQVLNLTSQNVRRFFHLGVRPSLRTFHITQLHHVLSKCMYAHDYEGGAQTLAVLFRHSNIDMKLCIQVRN